MKKLVLQYMPEEADNPPPPNSPPPWSGEIPVGPNVVIYCRVSSEKQAGEDKISLQTQEEACRAFCIQLGWNVVGVFVDHTTGEDPNRSGLRGVIEAGLKKRFKYLVFYHSDRLSRAGYLDEEMYELIRYHDVELVSVTEGSDLGTLGILMAVAAFENRRIRERTSDGRQGAAKKGRVPCGGLSYGYRKGKDGRPEADPDTAPVVKRIFREDGEGLSGKEIARELDEDGILPPKGKGLWQPSQIYRILRNPVYAEGIWYYGKTRRIREGRRTRIVKRPREEWIAIPVPILVDAGVWRRAQESKTDGSEKSKRNTGLCYPLQNLVYCDVCHKRFRVRADRYKGKSRQA